MTRCTRDTEWTGLSHTVTVELNMALVESTETTGVLCSSADLTFPTFVYNWNSTFTKALPFPPGHDVFSQHILLSGSSSVVFFFSFLYEKMSYLCLRAEFEYTLLRRCPHCPLQYFPSHCAVFIEGATCDFKVNEVVSGLLQPQDENLRLHRKEERCYSGSSLLFACLLPLMFELLRDWVNVSLIFVFHELCS